MLERLAISGNGVIFPPQDGEIQETSGNGEH